MKSNEILVFVFFLLLMTACQSSPGTDLSRCTSQPNESSAQSAAVESNPVPVIIEVGDKLLCVDQVVQGKLCDDVLSGVVYVPVDVQVANWEEDPVFLENCNFTVKPGTIVLVGAHDDDPYYNGCSCHEPR
jgi:hypothetical protein